MPSETDEPNPILNQLLWKGRKAREIKLNLYNGR